jgi:hypothetical protein
MTHRPSRAARLTRRIGGRPFAAEPAVDAPAGLVDFYAQRLDRSKCGEAAECARLQVPLDYDKPAAPRISLAVERVGRWTPPPGSDLWC